MNVDELKQLLSESGFEVYSADSCKVHLAERVRMHLMDAGVTVFAGTPTQVSFVVRSELSAAEELGPAEHHARIREAVAEDHAALGFVEVEASQRGIEDPGDPSRVLDTWYEIRFRGEVEPAELAERLRYCLARVKCVS